MKKILKTFGHCADGCGWKFCDFYVTSVNSPTKFYCSLFGMADKESSNALNICNKIYGDTYDGKP